MFIANKTKNLKKKNKVDQNLYITKTPVSKKKFQF